MGAKFHGVVKEVFLEDFLISDQISKRTDLCVHIGGNVCISFDFFGTK